MCNNIDLVIRKDGCTYYLEKCGGYINTFDIVDIDMEAGVETVAFGENSLSAETVIRGVFLEDVMKQFPDVKTLEIGAHVEIIKMSNFMFPNVQHVISNSIHYATGSVLINHDTLVNAFCKNNHSIIDMKNISYVNEHALDGCSAGFINVSTMLDYYVLEKAGYFSNPPDEKEEWCVSGSGGYVCYPEVGDDSMSLYFIIPDNPFSNSGSTPVRSIGISSCIRKMRDAVHIRIKENPYLKSVDDFVYSSDGKTLVQSPLWKEGEVVIPEGVTRIGGSAFSASRISSVVLPSSVTVVGTNAFSFCSKLRTVVLNEGLREIYSVAFEGDDKIKKIRLPESLTSVGYDAFSLSNLEEIEIGGNVIPQGLIRAVGKSDDNFPVKCNLGNGRTFFIPASLDKTVDISLVDDADLDTLYLFSLSSFAKRLCAVHAYKVSGREDTAKFLRRVAKSLVEYYFRKNDEPALVELVHMGVCTSATLTYALDNAKAKNMTTLTAEILSLTEESKKSKKSFNL